MRRGFINKASEGEESAIDLTPMLDVVFIMLIFFIVTASFVREAGVDVNRPEAKTAETKKNAKILIAITDTNEIWIDKRRIDILDVRANIERLRAEYPKGAVVVQADENAKTKTTVSVVDAAREAGAYDVAVSTKKTRG